MTATAPPLSQRRDVAVLVPAAGRGVRLGGATPKALRDLVGEPLLVHCCRNLAAAPSVGLIVIAAPPDAVDQVRALLPGATVAAAGHEPAAGASGGYAQVAEAATGAERQVAAGREPAAGMPDESEAVSNVEPQGSTMAAGPGAADDAEPQGVTVAIKVVAGGEERQESVARALAAVPEGFEIILVHDAARALAPPALIEAVAQAVRDGHDAVIPGLPVVDTIKQVSADDQVVATVDRSQLRAVQTPQGFRRSLLVKAHRAATDAHTDDAGLVERLGLPVHTVAGHPHALKITTPWDLVVAEAILRAE